MVGKGEALHCRGLGKIQQERDYRRRLFLGGFAFQGRRVAQGFALRGVEKHEVWTGEKAGRGRILNDEKRWLYRQAKSLQGILECLREAAQGRILGLHHCAAGFAGAPGHSGAERQLFYSPNLGGKIPGVFGPSPRRNLAGRLLHLGLLRGHGQPFERTCELRPGVGKHPGQAGRGRDDRSYCEWLAHGRKPRVPIWFSERRLFQMPGRIARDFARRGKAEEAGDLYKSALCGSGFDKNNIGNEHK